MQPDTTGTRPAFRRRLSVYARDLELGQGFPFLVFRESDNQLVGGLTLAHTRGHFVRAILEAAALAVRHLAGPILDAGIRVDAMRVCGTISVHTVCQIPVVRGYQIAWGSRRQSCLPRGLARSCGSS